MMAAIAALPFPAGDLPASVAGHMIFDRPAFSAHLALLLADCADPRARRGLIVQALTSARTEVLRTIA